MRNRNIVKMILLTVITLGIYYLYWLVSTTREMRAKGADIPNAILIIIPIINIWWMWKYSKGVEHITGDKLSAILTFILMYAVGFIGIYIVQDSFNDVGAGVTAGTPATATTGGQAQAPSGQPVDPASPAAAATATGAGVGVAASQVGDSAQAAPDAQSQEPPKPPEPAQPLAPEETQEPSTDLQEGTEQLPAEETAAQEDDSLQQPGTETEDPNQQETDEEDKNQSGDSTPPADPGPMSGPSI